MFKIGDKVRVKDEVYYYPHGKCRSMSGWVDEVVNVGTKGGDVRFDAGVFYMYNHELELKDAQSPHYFQD